VSPVAVQVVTTRASDPVAPSFTSCGRLEA